MAVVADPVHAQTDHHAHVHAHDPDRARARDDVIGWAAVGTVATGAVAVFCRHVLDVGPRDCLLRTHAGHPCPVCGLSTVAVRLLHDVPGALRLDPIGVTFLVVLGVLAGLQLARLAGGGGDRVPRVPTVLSWAVPLVLLAVHWVLTWNGVVTLVPLGS